MSHPEFDNAEAAFDHFYERSTKDPTLDFDEYCRAYPQFADAMRRERSQMERIRSLMHKIAPGQASQAALAQPPSKLGPALQGTLEQLNGKPGTAKRYEVQDEIGRGGMGVVYRAHDTVLEREVAMKVIRSSRSGSALVAKPSLEPRSVGRFVEEAQITAQLDHPSIVPIHDLGYDEHGDLFFTMRLVDGRTFAQLIELVANGDASWSMTRAVGVLSRVCETLAFAHTKGVIHRDLKPSNVMVGDFGAVYVMDWGLARVLDALHGAQPSSNGAAAPQGVKSDRRADGDSGSGLLTQIGDVVGTPAFMALEQAGGKPEDIGPLCDVYSVGAMLYALLVGRPPYSHPGESPPPSVVLARLLADPPAAVEFAARGDAPPELIAICEKAMARFPRDRYASALDLADDLRAYLEGRAVRAHDVGLATVARKWVARNRALTATAAGALVLAVGSTIWFLNSLQHEVDAKQRALSDLEAKTRDNNRVNHRLLAASLIDDSEGLYPATAEKVPAMDEWLLKADDLLKARVLYDAERSLPEGALDAIKKRDLVAVVAALDQLSTTRAAVAARRERADTLVRRSIDDHRRAWDDAIAAIAKSERYSMPDGSPLVIEPQVGLVPLGENPTTRLWEFWVLDSGDEPLRKGSHFEIGPRTGVVLILMCGTAEHPFHPFFGGKYEVTQGQWRLVMGSNPSDMSIDRMHVAQSNANRKNVDDRHPVEMITWLDAEHFCALLALRLLPQSDWRHLAGGERTGGRWTGLDPLSLIGQENIRHDPRHTGFDEADNFPYHAPVGSLGCNEHGAFDMLANVAEWLGTADVEHADASDPTLNHFLGGGDYRSELEQVTAKSDWKNRADLKNSVTGVRAGRTLKPCPACLAEGKSGH